MATPRVPLLDLVPQYEALKSELHEAVDRVVTSQYFILGPEVEQFEAEMAEYCQAEHCIGVSSGSDALIVSLMALGIGHGDEVITTAYTFFATGGAIARVGATPVFVDVDPVTFNIDPDHLESRITARTKAIMPVHLYGQCAEMSRIDAIARKHHLAVIEDAAQAIGAEYNGKRAGSLGTVGCFSFFPSKNLGAFGDGGAVTTNDAKLAERIRRLRMHGAVSEYQHDRIGGNFRLDALQAAVLRVKLRYLDQWHADRQANAALYCQYFRETGLTTAGCLTTPRAVTNRHVYNQYVIRVKDRDAVRNHLQEVGVATKVYYPTPLHLQNCFRYLGYAAGDCPQSEKASAETIALPIFPELTSEQIRYVVTSLADFYAVGETTRRAA